MAVEIIVPRLGWSMDEGVFSEWLKEDGQAVQEGDLLFVLESDKAAQEVESMDAGILRIPPYAPKPGDTVVVGQLLGYLVEEGEPVPSPSAATPKAAISPMGESKSLEEAVHIGAEIREKDAGPAARKEDEKSKGKQVSVAISPRARRLARELDLDWSTIRGSGRGGRIRERDIRAAAPALSSTRSAPDQQTAGAGQTVPVTPIRRTIAERMLTAVRDTAPVTLTTKGDASNLVNLRRQFTSATSSPDSVIPSYTDLIVKLAAVALEKHPMLNAQWRKDGIFIPEQIHIAIAVETQDGLLAPVLRDVGKLSLREVATQSSVLISSARSRKLAAQKMQGATFTISNLGNYGVDTFTPIISVPQCSVLGLGRILPEAVVVDAQIVVREMLSLSLTFDHRVVDGVPAAQFLDTVRSCIEQPGPWLMA